MGYTVEQLFKIANAEIGYKEKASNSDLDDKNANAGDGNYTKYARDLATAGYYNKNGLAWCDMFTDWCFYMLCGSDKEKALSMTHQARNNGASCTASMKNYKASGKLYDAPYSGDQIFMGKKDGEADHTGIVFKDDATGEFFVIHGNWGGEVSKDSLATLESEYAYIKYGRPLYETFEANFDAIQRAIEQNFFIVNLKSVSSTEASAEVKLLKDTVYKWSYTLTDLISNSALVKDLELRPADLDNIELTGLTPYTPYALKIMASGSSKQLFFSTTQVYPNAIEDLNCTFSLDNSKCSIQFKSPDYLSEYGTAVGYRVCLIINGKIVSYRDDLIKQAIDGQSVTITLSAFSEFNAISYGDIIQIGVQTFIKAADGKIILSRDGVVSSQPFYIKGPLTPVNKIQAKIADDFKQAVLWLNI